MDDFKQWKEEDFNSEIRFSNLIRTLHEWKIDPCTRSHSVRSLIVSSLFTVLRRNKEFIPAPVRKEQAEFSAYLEEKSPFHLSSTNTVSFRFSQVLAIRIRDKTIPRPYATRVDENSMYGFSASEIFPRPLLPQCRSDTWGIYRCFSRGRIDFPSRFDGLNYDFLNTGAFLSEWNRFEFSEILRENGWFMYFPI